MWGELSKPTSAPFPVSFLLHQSSSPLISLCMKLCMQLSPEGLDYVKVKEEGGGRLDEKRVRKVCMRGLRRTTVLDEGEESAAMEHHVLA